MTIAQWSTTAALNVVSSGTVGTGGVNINEGMFPSGVNDAMRDLMAQIATFRTAGTVATFFGQVIVGHTAQLAIANTDSVQIIGTTVATTGLGMLSFINGGQAHVDFYSSPSGAIGTYAPVVSGASLGGLNWYGAQQTGTAANWNRAAQIRAEVDGTVTDGAGADMPGRIIFSTSPDGSGTIAERMRIASDGTVTIAAGGALVLPQAASPLPTVEGDMRWDTDDDVLRIGTGAATKQIGIAIGTAQATTSGTAKTYTVPAGAKRVTLTLADVSTNGTNNLVLGIGDSGGIETTLYNQAVVTAAAAGNTVNNGAGAFILVNVVVAAGAYTGTVTLSLQDAATFRWVASWVISMNGGTTQVSSGGGWRTLDSALLSIELSAGGNTFDAGMINATFE